MAEVAERRFRESHAGVFACRAKVLRAAVSRFCGGAVPRCPLAVPRFPLAVPRFPLAVPRFPLAVPRFPLAVPRFPLAVPRFPLAVPRFPLAVPRFPLAVPRFPLAVPRCPLAVPRFPLAVARRCTFRPPYELPQGHSLSLPPPPQKKITGLRAALVVVTLFLLDSYALSILISELVGRGCLQENPVTHRLFTTQHPSVLAWHQHLLLLTTVKNHLIIFQLSFGQYNTPSPSSMDTTDKNVYYRTSS